MKRAILSILFLTACVGQEPDTTTSTPQAIEEHDQIVTSGIRITGGDEGGSNSAIYAPNGWIYGKHALFGDYSDTALGVLGTINLGPLRFHSQHDFSASTSIHDYHGTGIDQTSDMRVTPTANIDLTGIQDAGDNFRLMCLQNRSGSYTVNVRNNNDGSTGGNRFRFPGDADNWELEPYAKACWAHDFSGSYGGADDAWKLIGWGSTHWPHLVVRDYVRLGSANGPMVTSGSGSPEGNVTAPVGSMYTRTDGGANTTLYVKECGTGASGWVAK